ESDSALSDLVAFNRAKPMTRPLAVATCSNRTTGSGVTISSIAPLRRALLQKRGDTFLLIFRIKQIDERLALAWQGLLHGIAPRALDQPLACRDAGWALLGRLQRPIHRALQRAPLRHHLLDQTNR